MVTGDRIKELRLEKGLTQEQLGELLGLGKAAINKYESGTVENLKRSTIAKLAEIFDVSPTYLLGIDNRKKLTPEQIESELSYEDLNLYNRIKQLPPERRRLVDAQIQAWLEVD